MIVGPDGQPVGDDPEERAAHDLRRRRRGRRPRGRAPHHRAGRAAREGDADRLDDPPAARRGEGRAARRGQPQPPQGDPPGVDQGARGRPRARAASTSSSGSRSPSPRRASPPRASSGSRRRSSSAGSRASSTASRPRSTPSRWPPAVSWNRCARRCPAWLPSRDSTVEQGQPQGMPTMPTQDVARVGCERDVPLVVAAARARQPFAVPPMHFHSSESKFIEG